MGAIVKKRASEIGVTKKTDFWWLWKKIVIVDNLGKATDLSCNQVLMSNLKFKFWMDSPMYVTKVLNNDPLS